MLSLGIQGEETISKGMEIVKNKKNNFK